VRALYRPAAQLDRPGGNSIRAKHIKAYCRSYYINDRVQGAYFMKSNFAGAYAVNFGFRFGDTGKNCNGAFFRARVYGGLFDQRPYVAPGMVRVNTAVPAGALMIMIAAAAAVAVVFVMPMIMMPVPGIMAAIVIVGNVIRPAFQVNNRVKAAEASAFSLDKIEFPAFNTKFGKFRPQLFRVNTEIDQGAQGHVA
jgi:hypothetical protein